MDVEGISAIALFPYKGARSCMGYPLHKRNHAPAQYYFRTPKVIREEFPDKAQYVFLCIDCVSEFLGEVALGIAFASNS